MWSTRGKPSRREKHPYLSGNFAPVTQTCALTPCTYTGTIPKEMHGGQYIRNGANPLANSDLGRDAHWFDGDGMLAGVLFQRSPHDPEKIVPHFVSQYVLTDVFLSSLDTPSLRAPFLPSIATLVNPLASLMVIVSAILRTVMLVILSLLPGSSQKVKRISVANTGLVFHDGRALATCESGPPIRVWLPSFDTVGWFDGTSAEGEGDRNPNQQVLGGNGLTGFLKEWTTGHPKVDPDTGELILYHCSFVPPFVHYSIILPTQKHSYFPNYSPKSLNIPVPGVSGAKMMHDFGVSKYHTVILDLPLFLDPLNLLKGGSVVDYDPNGSARFGIFPRRKLDEIIWFETKGCCIFHVANTWDTFNADGSTTISMLACRLNSAAIIYRAGNVSEPRHDRSPHSKSTNTQALAEEEQEEDQCRLYLYKFHLQSHTLTPNSTPTILSQHALSAIPFELPTLNPAYEMHSAQYIYGCSTTTASFSAALGRATKIDVLVKMSVRSLISRGEQNPPPSVTGCVDTRAVDEVRWSEDANESIKVFVMPQGWYLQEARYVSRAPRHRDGDGENEVDEDDGYLLFYAFDEGQLDAEGECGSDAVSELWVLDARGMRDVLARVRLPRRVPYGLHGNWFSEDMIRGQRGFERLRKVPDAGSGGEGMWGTTRKWIVGFLG